MDVPAIILKELSDVDFLYSDVFAQKFKIDHTMVVGGIKSLLSYPDIISVEQLTETNFDITTEGQYILMNGSHEYVVFNLVPEEGILKERLEKTSQYAKIGITKAVAAKWIKFQKNNDGKIEVLKNVDSVVDDVQKLLIHMKKMDLNDIPKASIADFKKRKLISEVKTTRYIVKKGPSFKTDLQKEEIDLTPEMLASFWNFDSLFQPQQHPARDAHDTFFISDPSTTDVLATCPPDYVSAVEEVHRNGGYGSKGYNYDWKMSEAQKNLLRTHTTAVSARMLKKLAESEKPIKPVRYFSIDRVFRNESLDATHLAEFHQVEGLVADYGIGLGHLKAVIRAFFQKLGLTKLRFKPAYNPYTEPSMEIFSFHPGLGKWVEIGNSGIFRPEMLRPMGLPSNLNVIAWGLSLERPTMIRYGYKNIRDLIGPKVDLNMIYNSPLCRIERYSEV